MTPYIIPATIQSSIKERALGNQFAYFGQVSCVKASLKGPVISDLQGSAVTIGALAILSEDPVLKPFSNFTISVA